MAALAQDLLEQRTGLKYPNGYGHDQYVAAFAAKLDGCVLHALSREATAMAAQVGLSKPSSILKALKFAKPPFPRTWIEFDRRHLREAMEALGSPLVKRDGHDVAQARIGFLVEEELDRLTVSAVQEQVSRDGRKLIDPLVVQFAIETGPFDSPSTGEGARSVHPDATGRLRSYLRTVASDSAEANAADEIAARCASRSTLPEAKPLLRALRLIMDEPAVARISQEGADQCTGIAIQVLVPALILLACKNAVDVVERPAEPKLNAIRAKKGKPGILRIRDVISRFTKRRGADAKGAPSSSALERMAALVSGHFKTRESGVYWWSHHARRGKGKAATTRMVRP